MDLKPYTFEVGERFGTLTVEQDLGRVGGAKSLRVACDCSFVFIARASKLRKGVVKCSRCSPAKIPLIGRTLAAHAAGKRDR